MNIRYSPQDEWATTLIAELEKHRLDGWMLDDTKPAAVIISERYEEMWQAILSQCDELRRQQPDYDPGSRSSGTVGSDGRSMSAVLELRHKSDGTSIRYHVQAYFQPNLRTQITVTADGPWLDNHDQFWAEQASDRSNAVVIASTHYRILPDLPASKPRELAGHGGRLFRIRLLATGNITETCNLWYQGIIPPSWRDRLPDNAEFIPEESRSSSLAAALNGTGTEAQS